MKERLIRFLGSVAALLIASDGHADWLRRYSAEFSTPLAIRAVTAGRIAVGLTSGALLVDSKGDVQSAVSWPHFSQRVAIAPAGTIFSLGGQSEGLYVTKLNGDLSLAWDRSLTAIGGPANSLAPLDDGGVIIAAMNSHGPAAARLDRDGNLRWAKSFDISGDDVLTSVAPTADGGFVFAGVRDDTPWMLKINGDGTIAWDHMWNMPGRLDGVCVTSDGAIMAVGISETKLLLVKLATNGRVQWMKRQTSAQISTSPAIVPLANGTALIGAVAMPVGYSVMTVDATGGVRWSKEAQLAKAGACAIASAGDAVILGPQVTDDLRLRPLLLQLTRDGSSGCATSAETFALGNFSAPAAEVTVEQPNFSAQSVPLEAKPLAPRSVVAEAVECPRAEAAPLTASTPEAFTGYEERRAQQASYRDLLSHREFAKLDELAATFRRTKSFADPANSDLMNFYEGLRGGAGADESQSLALVDAWIAARPSSVTARLVFADMLIDMAWKRRGGGYSDTVTQNGWAEFDSLMQKARRALADAGPAAADDPKYHQLLVRLAGDLGDGDVAALATAAASRTHDMWVFLSASWYLSNKWGGSPKVNGDFIARAATLTKTTFGDGLYAYLAYQAAYGLSREEFADIRLDSARVRSGCRDMIAASPKWVPTYHRCAMIAYRLGDDDAVRRLFARPELAWFPEARSIWHGNDYEAARMVAMTNSQTAQPPTGPWPAIVMQGEAAFRPTATPHRTTAFLIKTDDGPLAVSAIAAQTSPSEEPSAIDDAKKHLVSWTLSAPAHPEQQFVVQSILTVGKQPFQNGVALKLAPDAAIPAVKALPVSKNLSQDGPFLIIGCAWSGNTCKQVVLLGTLKAGTYDKNGIGRFTMEMRKPVSWSDLVGAAVINGAGEAVGVVTGHVAGQPNGPVILIADNIGAVLSR
jgi:hypothetical protein